VTVGIVSAKGPRPIGNGRSRDLIQTDAAINQAKGLLYYLVHRGPWVGVYMFPNSRGLAKYYDLATHKGVVVSDVVRGSPAARAGIRSFDVVTHVDKQPVATPEEMQQAIRKHRIGEATTLSIERRDGTMQIRVKTGRLPDGYSGG